MSTPTLNSYSGRARCLRAVSLFVTHCAVLAACGHPGDSSGTTGSLSIASPADSTVVHDTLTLQLAFTGRTPKSLGLLLDGNPFASTALLPNTLFVDTTHITDGVHTFIAEAQDGTLVWLSNSVSLTVDNTHPVPSFSPVPGDANADVRAPITVTFSKPIDPSTLGTNPVKLSTGGGCTSYRFFIWRRSDSFNPTDIRY